MILRAHYSVFFIQRPADLLPQMFFSVFVMITELRIDRHGQSKLHPIFSYTMVTSPVLCNI